MQRNDLFRDNGTIYRVIEIGVGRVLVIDCIKLTMPTWVADNQYDLETKYIVLVALVVEYYE